MPFLAGQTLTAGMLNLATTRIIAYGQRLSSTTPTGSEHGVLRLDDVPVIGGRLYRIKGKGQGDVATNGDTIRWNLRYTEDGSTPTTASTILELDQGDVPDAAISETNFVERLYAPASSLNFSVLLTIARPVGVSNFSAVGAVDQTIELTIEDLGEDPGDTGTEI